MKVTIDTDTRTLAVQDGSAVQVHDLYSPEAFALLSRHWLRVGWSQRYSYGFAWLGRPVIQLPEDLLRLQDAVYQLAPDVLIETGVAHGGSLVFAASVFHALGRGRVIGIDLDIRPHNRSALEAHPLHSYLTLVEGSSVAPEVLHQVRALIAPDEVVMVVLDSAHSYQHVLAELRAYADLVSPGSYLVVEDGVMQDLTDVPGGRAEWARDNPARAVRDFLDERSDFVAEPPTWTFNESRVLQAVTYYPEGWLRRRPRGPRASSARPG